MCIEDEVNSSTTKVGETLTPIQQLCVADAVWNSVATFLLKDCITPLQNRPDITGMLQGKQKFKPVLFKPKSKRCFWSGDKVIANIMDNGILVTSEEMLHLVKELDRRFVQLWDKVIHENNLEVDDNEKI